jgi:formate hydrogenlyase subunit 6/NADH:ubiquinone oxidoreductase subunit I
MNNIIYFFTGTGNSLALARSLAHKTNCEEVIPIAKAIVERLPEKVDKLGIVCPNYGFNIPHIVKRFIKKIRNETNIDYIYIVISAGGNNGNVVDKVKKGLKKFPLKAIFTLLMPTNYIPFVNIFDSEKVRLRLENAEVKLTEIAKKITLKEVFFDSKVDYHKVAIMPGLLYSLAYPLIPKMDKNFWLSNTCNGCAVCQKVCPVRNIKMLNERPNWQHHCEQCFACVHWCPKIAIQYGKNTENKERYHHHEIKLKNMLLFE